MSQATEMLAFYITAETNCLKGADVRWGDRRMVMSDLAEIRSGRQEWQGKVNAEVLAGAGKSSTRTATASFRHRHGRDCE